jgi:hypothetical protein
VAPTDITNVGSDRVLGTEKPLEHYLHEYEKTLLQSHSNTRRKFQLGNSMQQSVGQAVAGCACCTSPQQALTSMSVNRPACGELFHLVQGAAARYKKFR